jgi:A/G-specific adenine glycosylase
MSVNLSLFHQQLFEWWHRAGRVLPWREKQGGVSSVHKLSVRERAFTHYFAGELRRDPYRIVVSEMMLQQTQVDRVLPKFEAWMSQWPTVDHLAQATLPEVLIAWQGLGYNRRARFLWLIAKKITEDLKGKWPSTEEELLELPGIGKYTARALMSFALGQHVGVVDTNIKRVLSRVTMGSEVDKTLPEKTFFELADQILPAGQADPWNQALMDLGALVCTAKKPNCPVCPLQNLCLANLNAQAQGFEFYGD